MKFTNLLPINNSGQIEVFKTDFAWDLHNTADFLGYRHDQENNTILLSWDYGCDCCDNVGGIISLEFLNLKHLDISEVDLGMPRDEDKCLDQIQRLNENTIELSFRGGQVFTIECDEVIFHSNNTKGHKV